MIKNKTEKIKMRLSSKMQIGSIGAFLFVDFYRIKAVIG